jgi:hypothetical protein
MVSKGFESGEPNVKSTRQLSRMLAPSLLCPRLVRGFFIAVLVGQRLLLYFLRDL